MKSVNTGVLFVKHLFVFNGWILLCDQSSGGWTVFLHGDRIVKFTHHFVELITVKCSLRVIWTHLMYKGRLLNMTTALPVDHQSCKFCIQSQSSLLKLLITEFIGWTWVVCSTLVHLHFLWRTLGFNLFGWRYALLRNDDLLRNLHWRRYDDRWGDLHWFAHSSRNWGSHWWRLRDNPSFVNNLLGRGSGSLGGWLFDNVCWHCRFCKFWELGVVVLGIFKRWSGVLSRTSGCRLLAGRFCWTFRSHRPLRNSTIVVDLKSMAGTSYQNSEWFCSARFFGNKIRVHWTITHETFKVMILLQSQRIKIVGAQSI